MENELELTEHTEADIRGKWYAIRTYTSHEEKVKVINEFKKVNSINESQEKYKTLVREITNTKKSITESVEKLVSTSIQPSSSKLVNEAIETTVYSKDKNIQRMKRLIDYNENK